MMTEQTTFELMSRHLDGDLSSAEEEDLRQRLESRPALASELHHLHALRRTVARIAAREQPPAQLDALIDPLLRARPEPVRVRPWVRWLATAAIVVLGLTVIIDVNRRSPPTDANESRGRTAEKNRAETSEPFALAPLPTSSLPADERPLGVSDRLLASPIPVPNIEVDAPPALEVLGPLEAPANDRIEGVPGGNTDAARPRVEIPAELAAAGDAAEEAAAQQPRRDQASPSHAEREKAASADAGRGSAPLWEPGPPTGLAQLFVFVDGRSAWREFTPPASCKPGRYSVRIEIGGGTVRVARPVGGAVSESPSQRLCAAELIIGLEISEVADGEYPAEVVVEPRVTR